MHARLTGFAAIFAAGVLSGCAISHDVAQLGPDTYSVSASAAPARGGASGARSMAIRQAGEYCASQNRRVLVTNISGQTTNGYGAGSTDVMFRCLAANDPTLGRPTYEPTPDVLVKVK